MNKYDSLPEQAKDFLDEVDENLVYNTYRSYEDALYSFCKFLKEEKNLRFVDIEAIRNVQSNDVVRFQHYLITKGLSNSSINTKVRIIGKWFNWMIEIDYTDFNPVSEVKALEAEKKEPIYFTEEERLSMEESTDDLRDKLIIKMLFATGMTRSEVSAIAVTDIADHNHYGYIFVPSMGKTVELDDEIMELLDEYMQNHEGEYLFTSERDHSDHLSGEAIRTIFDEAKKKARIDPNRAKELTVYKARYTALKEMAQTKELENIATA